MAQETGQRGLAGPSLAARTRRALKTTEPQRVSSACWLIYLRSAASLWSSENSAKARSRLCRSLQGREEQQRHSASARYTLLTATGNWLCRGSWSWKSQPLSHLDHEFHQVIKTLIFVKHEHNQAGIKRIPRTLAKAITSEIPSISFLKTDPQDPRQHGCPASNSEDRPSLAAPSV